MESTIGPSFKIKLTNCRQAATSGTPSQAKEQATKETPNLQANHYSTSVEKARLSTSVFVAQWLHTSNMQSISRKVQLGKDPMHCHVMLHIS